MSYDNDEQYVQRRYRKIKHVKKPNVDKKELLTEIVDYKNTGKCSERLGELFMNLVDNLALKTNFSGYPFLTDMKAKAIYCLLKYSRTFDPERSDQAFSYCTQIAYNAFVQEIKREKKILETKRAFLEKRLREEKLDH